MREGIYKTCNKGLQNHQGSTNQKHSITTLARDLNRCFTKENVLKAKNTWQKCSPLLVHKKMRVKITMRHSYTFLNRYNFKGQTRPSVGRDPEQLGYCRSAGHRAASDSWAGNCRTASTTHTHGQTVESHNCTLSWRSDRAPSTQTPTPCVE